MNVKHVESCLCGSMDISVVHSVNTPSMGAKMVCDSCGYSVAYVFPASKTKTLTLGQVLEDLLVLWDTDMINKKLVKELDISEESYLKEEMATNLLQLSSLIETASKEELVLAPASKERIKKTMNMIQRIMPAMSGLEHTSRQYFNEALSELQECKEKIRFNLVSNGN